MAGIRGHADDWPVLILILAILATIAVTQYRKVSADLEAKKGAAAASASAVVAVPTVMPPP